MSAQSAYRGFQIAFGIDQEVGRYHDFLAFFHTVQHFDITITARTYPDLARFEAPFCQLDKEKMAGRTLETADHLTIGIPLSDPGGSGRYLLRRNQDRSS